MKGNAMTHGDLTTVQFNTLYEPNDEIPPEVAMWRAVIMQQLVDAASNSRLPYKRKEKKEAIRWLTEYSQDFKDVCEHADLDPRYVRKHARLALKRKCLWRKYNRNSFQGGKK